MSSINSRAKAPLSGTRRSPDGPFNSVSGFAIGLTVLALMYVAMSQLLPAPDSAIGSYFTQTLETEAQWGTF